MYARHSLLSVFLGALFSYASNVRYGKGTKWNKKFNNVLSTGCYYPEQITSWLCPYLPNFMKMESNTLRDIQYAKLILDFILLLTCWHVACASSEAHHYVVLSIYFTSTLRRPGAHLSAILCWNLTVCKCRDSYGEEQEHFKVMW